MTARVRSRSPQIRSEWELERMRCAGRVVAQILQELQERIRPGWTTGEIDRWAAQRLSQMGATAAFQGYYGFPACVCVCLNHELVHGVPHPQRVIQPGDLVKVDLGACVEGWHSDASITLGMEPISAQAQHLIEATQQALERGLAQVRAGVPLQRISGAIEAYVHSQGYRVSQRYMGHGIGLHLHEWPPVPNRVMEQLPNPYLQAGMTLAIEPILLTGSEETGVLADGWTVVTQDGGWSAQWEHTIKVTSSGYEILTSLG